MLRERSTIARTNLAPTQFRPNYLYLDVVRTLTSHQSRPSDFAGQARGRLATPFLPSRALQQIRRLHPAQKLIP